MQNSVVQQLQRLASRRDRWRRCAPTGRLVFPAAAGEREAAPLPEHSRSGRSISPYPGGPLIATHHCPPGLTVGPSHRTIPCDCCGACHLLHCMQTLAAGTRSYPGGGHGCSPAATSRIPVCTCCANAVALSSWAAQLAQLVLRSPHAGPERRTRMSRVGRRGKQNAA